MKELSMECKKSHTSNNRIITYDIDPNQKYVLVQGTNNKTKIRWELITDGFIKQEELMVGFEKCFWENPSSDNPTRLKNIDAKRVSLEKSSYAVMQGFENSKLKRIKIYTQLTDIEKITKIMEIANIKYPEQDRLISKNKPYVRQITLN